MPGSNPDSATAPKATGGHATRSTRSRRWQWSLKSVLLLTTFVAVWITYGSFWRQNQQLRQQIQAMQALAPRLEVADPSQIAVLGRPPTWMNEHIWDLYLPQGMRYQLSLATRDIDEEGFAPATSRASISPGRHHLELKQQRTETGWQVQVLLDDATAMEVNEPNDWNPNTGSEGGSNFGASVSLPADQRVGLFRRRFSPARQDGQYKGPQGATTGVQLWIEVAGVGGEPNG